jgi:hypothetical protein
MRKPKPRRLSERTSKVNKARNDRRKQTIARRTAGQFNDLPPGQRQRVLQNLRS